MVSVPCVAHCVPPPCPPLSSLEPGRNEAPLASLGTIVRSWSTGRAGKARKTARSERWRRGVAATALRCSWLTLLCVSLLPPYPSSCSSSGGRAQDALCRRRPTRTSSWPRHIGAAEQRSEVSTSLASALSPAFCAALYALCQCSETFTMPLWDATLAPKQPGKRKGRRA